MAAGYGLPAGIEAHILHYATELRLHGFDTAVVVFKALPAERHRFLTALDARGISIRSLEALGASRARSALCALFLPWHAYILLRYGRRPDAAGFRIWTKRLGALRALRRLLDTERPDLIHVFGRLPTEAWARLPAERTIFHEMMTGTVDRHWNETELVDFRAFAARAARFFAPGSGVADNVRQAFGITRPIKPIFTMCPDEANAKRGTRNAESGSEKPEARRQATEHGEQNGNTDRRADESPNHPTIESSFRRLRFGVICRLTGQKGIRYLLDALRLFRDRRVNVDFTFGGIGPMEEEIRHFAEANGLEHVRVVRVNSAPEILASIDVFVHPSVDDAMPVAIAEALMCGCPCLVTRVGGIPDLVRDGVEGFVIEPRHAEMIVDRMERFATMPPAEFEAFRIRARARYEEVCRPDSVGRVVAAEYRQILAAVHA